MRRGVRHAIRGWRGGARLAGVALGLLVACARLAGAQTSGSVSVVGPDGNPIREGTPRFVITAKGFAASELPLQLTLQLSLRSDFTGALLVDTTVTGGSTVIVVPHVLPERITVWWRVRSRTALGALVLSDPTGPRTTATWLTLVAPNNANGTTIGTVRPTFVWTSAHLYAPAKPWRYLLTIFSNLRGDPVQTATLSDTVFTAFADLESNTSYRWSVRAAVPGDDSITVQSASTFVIRDANAPLATTLFQNFPNPFPTARVASTCIWFDLRVQSDVSLDVFDLRGNHVARILPGRGLGVGSTLPAGRYGRSDPQSDSGCDPRLTWDGRADDGRVVPAGVYLIRFKGDGVTKTVSALWKGH